MYIEYLDKFQFLRFPLAPHFSSIIKVGFSGGFSFWNKSQFSILSFFFAAQVCQCKMQSLEKVEWSCFYSAAVYIGWKRYWNVCHHDVSIMRFFFGNKSSWYTEKHQLFRPWGCCAAVNVSFCHAPPDIVRHFFPGSFRAHTSSFVWLVLSYCYPSLILTSQVKSYLSANINN